MRSLAIGLGLVLLVGLLAVGLPTAGLILAPEATIRGLQGAMTSSALGDPIWVETPVGRVRTWQAGQGAETWVLVHGFGDSGSAWVPVASELAADHRVVVLDLPGHGASEPQTERLVFGQVLTGLDAVLDTLDGPLVLVGNSMGGWASARWAEDNLGRASRVILVNAAGLPHTPVDRSLLMPTDRAGMQAKARAILGKQGGEVPGIVLDAVQVITDTPRLRTLYDDLQSREGIHLSQPETLPLELVWGTPDPFFPVDGYLDRLQAAAPQAPTTLLEGCGHAPQYSCPVALVRALRHPPE